MNKALDVTKGFDLQDEEEVRSMKKALFEACNSTATAIRLGELAMELYNTEDSKEKDSINESFLREALTLKLLLTLQDILENKHPPKDTSFTF